MNRKIDATVINEKIDIVDLIGESFALHPMGSNKMHARGVHDSLEVYTDQNTWYWYSQDAGSSVIDWYMHIHSVDFTTALKELDARLHGSDYTPRPAQPKRPAQAKFEKWHSDSYQSSMRSTIDMSAKSLASSDAGAAREYLSGRGLETTTWAAFELGYKITNNPNVGEKQPSIVIPWQNDKITGIEYRFLVDVPDGATDEEKSALKGQRFSSWGKRYLFGMNQARGESNTALLVEGPINAMSVWQVMQGSDLKIDVVSYGAQGALKNGDVQKIMKAFAKRYEYHIVWADEAENVAAASAILPKAHLTKSPFDMDTNDMLVNGSLLVYMEALIRRVSPDAGKAVAATKPPVNKPRYAELSQVQTTALPLVNSEPPAWMDDEPPMSIHDVELFDSPPVTPMENFSTPTGYEFWLREILDTPAEAEAFAAMKRQTTPYLWTVIGRVAMGYRLIAQAGL